MRDVDFGADHMLHAEGEIRHGDLFLDAIIDAVNVLILISRQVQDRLAHGLARNGSRIDANAPHALHFFNQGDAFARLRRLDSSALPGWAGADHDQVKSLHITVFASIIGG